MKIEREELLELIRRSREKDLDAQEELVRAVQDRVYYHCKKMLKNKEDAEDTTQTVLMTMIASLDKLKEPAAFWAWVNGITANQCKHLLTAPHKEWQIPEDEEGNSMLESVENLDETLVPEKVLDNEETRRIILGLVDELPPEQRMSVLFYYYDEMSVKQIAEAMDTSEGTVKSRLNYARKSIKAGVEDYERKGVKLYGVSPLVLLVFFLRQEADGTLLDPATAAAVAGQVLSPAGSGAVSGGAAAGGAGAAAEGGASSAGGAASAAAKAGAAAGKAVAAAGTAVKAGISMKLIAGIVAAAIVVGGGLSILTKPNQPEWRDIASGSTFTALVGEDDSLWMCGIWHDVENLPEASDIVSKVLEDVYKVEIRQYTDISSNMAVIKTDGTLWLWPDMLMMEMPSVPIRLADNVIDVSLGAQSGALIEEDGSLWTWKDKWGPNTDISIPELTHVMDDAVAVSCGKYHYAAITSDGSLWTWGDNNYGQLGIGETDENIISEPVKVMENVIDVSCGSSDITAAVTADGVLWAWGAPVRQLGIDSEDLAPVQEPVQVMEDVVNVESGPDTMAAIAADGALWMWGINNRGQIGQGDGSPNYYFAPTKVMEDITYVACSGRTTAAIQADGTAWAWGDNIYAQLGTGDRIQSFVPVEMQFATGNPDLSPWVDPEPSAEPAPEEPEAEELPDVTEEPEEPEQPSYPEAYAAYLTALDSHAEMIDMYARWYEEINYAIYPVAFADVYGDETPEMIFVEADETYPWSESYLTILTYQGGQVSTLLRESWDFYAGSMLTYTLFQSADGKTLYADTGYSTSQQVTERYVFSESAGALTMEQVKELPSMDELVLSNRYAVDAAMTREEAAGFLAENGKA